MIGPRVRVRVRPRCDDDCPPCESPWAHPLVVAAATVVFQVLGEVIVRRLTADDDEPKPTRKAAGK